MVRAKGLQKTLKNRLEQLSSEEPREQDPKEYNRD
jgi:hypothetical protein